MMRKLSALTPRPGSAKVLSNMSWLMVDKALRLGVSVFVGAWMARYLGPEQFGLLSYATAFVMLFTTIATLGLQSVVVRDLTNTPELSYQILGTTFVMRGLGSLIAATMAFGSIVLLRPDQPQTWLLIGITAIGLIIQSLETLDLWYQSQTQSKYVVLSKGIAFLTANLAKIILMSLNMPLLWFAMVGLIEIAIAMGGLALFYQQHSSLLHWRFSFRLAQHLLRDGWTEIFSGLAILIYLKIDQTMLGEMIGNQAVGVYAAALRLSETWYFLPVAVYSSLLPTIVRLRQTDQDLYYQRLTSIFNLMTLTAYAIALPIALVSEPLILTLFGAEFQPAGLILAIHIWAAPFVFLGTVQSLWNTAENLLRLSLQRTLIGACLNVILNLILIPKFSGVGAALATVVSYAFSSIVMNAFSTRTHSIFQMQLRALICPSVRRFVQDVRQLKVS
ncbi:MAG: flippase [Leptolyngbya sp. UWPOB_LEPTO1]|uniref:flippase n=1 Tax=Leptolyngbya sp. UWPOB_LEPTO1 TaxID=2815653 RepID=UPI001ACC2AA5|nr:flippase [Leptolyngbya sp. UWPOB_LEPTO1]MBN8560363.1 flippase [Leptolyngbya sp. UWPOB_LEPTO1]